MLKERQKYLKNHNRYNNRDENDNVINIKVNNTQDLISPFQEDEASVINEEFAQLLKNTVKRTNPNKLLTIKIAGVDNAERTKVVKSIKNYFYHELAESEREYKRKLLYSLASFLIGMTFLVSFLILTELDKSEIISSTLEIFCWVFTWESVDIFAFSRTHTKHEMKRYLNFISANIIFL